MALSNIVYEADGFEPERSFAWFQQIAAISHYISSQLDVENALLRARLQMIDSKEQQETIDYQGIQAGTWHEWSSQIIDSVGFNESYDIDQWEGFKPDQVIRKLKMETARATEILGDKTF